MSNVPSNVGVFFGKTDKRSEGWYWVDASAKAPKGPFQTKAQAIENAIQSLRHAPSGGQEKGGLREECET